MKRLKVFGSDNIGLYIKASNSFFLYHSSIPDKKIREVESELETIPVPVYLINTLILSPFIVCNNNGVILPYLFEEYAKEELVRRLKNLDINIGVIKEKYTSLGNLVLANDKGAIVSPILSLSARKMIADTLDIEVISSTIGRFSYVGSMAVSNNNGVLASPVAKDDEIRMIEDVLKVSLYTGTINGGIEFVSSGIVANDNGVVVGSSTTGRELMIISQAFGVD